MSETYFFLFDLDGTLVKTDKIYMEVWRKLLEKYNIYLTDDIYKSFIQGNNDSMVINHCLNLNIDIVELSKEKDRLFLECLDKIEIIENGKEFIKGICERGHKCCIVTNCNQRTAKEIVECIGIEEYIDFIISGDEVERGKPYPDPYLKAIERYNVDKSKCIIFEDSKVGILSAKLVNPKMIVGVESVYNSKELYEMGVHKTIKDYHKMEIDELIYFEYMTYERIKKMVNETMKYVYDKNEVHYVYNETNLKGGFIASVIAFECELEDKTESYIVKYENERVNNLSLMAKRLELYQREYYFYENVSKYFNHVIKIPTFLGCIYDDEMNACGMILENLYKKGKMKVNVNLNVESVDISLKIIDRMAKMHSVFWDKNIKRILPKLNGSMDNLFHPFFENYIEEKYLLFYEKWKHVLTEKQMKRMTNIYENFGEIQRSMSVSPTTFIHGDIKSANIFYDIENGYEPYFLDYQHCAIGKGVQDLIFFVIESFEIEKIKVVYPIFKNYYFEKLKENGIQNYRMEDYERDIKNALCYVPFFTAIWFGSLSYDELIDKNWPYFFIQKLVFMLEFINVE
jgi:beta-phosphoglucomutase